MVQLGRDEKICENLEEPEQYLIDIMDIQADLWEEEMKLQEAEIEVYEYNIRKVY